MKLTLSLMVLALLASPVLLANSFECNKADSTCQLPATAETIKVSVFDAKGKIIRSHIIGGYTDAMLSTRSAQTKSTVLLKTSDPLTTSDEAMKLPRQQVLNTWEATQADGTLVMIMVIGYFRAGETTAFHVKVVESRFPESPTSELALQH